MRNFLIILIIKVNPLILSCFDIINILLILKCCRKSKPKSDLHHQNIVIEINRAINNNIGVAEMLQKYVSLLGMRLINGRAFLFL